MYHRGDESVLSAYLAGESVVECAEGGGFRSVAVVGMLEALAEAKKKPKARVGVSGGACAEAGAKSGAVEAAFAIYEKLAQDHCLTIVRKNTWPYIEVQFDREKLLRELEANMNVSALQRDPGAFGVSVLIRDTGEGDILDAKEDTLNVLRAGVSIAGTCKPVVINGKEIVDGMNLRIKPAVRKYWARNVLVLRSRYRWWWEEACYPRLVRNSLKDEPPALLDAIADADARLERELDMLRNCTHIKYLEIGPGSGDPLHFPGMFPWVQGGDPFLLPWTTTSWMLTQMRVRAREYVLRLMDKACRR